ncbi:hypothetical protein HAX54_027259, partial [Datura stramonium]|nr:hypothetical protein [Datura stramonium]
MEGGEVVGAVMAGGVRGWRFSGCHLVVVSRQNSEGEEERKRQVCWVRREMKEDDDVE